MDTFRIKDKIRGIKKSLSHSANTFLTSEKSTPLYIQKRGEETSTDQALQIRSCYKYVVKMTW